MKALKEKNVHFFRNGKSCENVCIFKRALRYPLQEYALRVVCVRTPSTLANSFPLHHSHTTASDTHQCERVSYYCLQFSNWAYRITSNYRLDLMQRRQAKQLHSLSHGDTSSFTQ
jgi:hypothetical protein